MSTTKVLRTRRLGIAASPQDGCRLFRIRCDILCGDTLDRLTSMIEDALARGSKSIVLSLTADSYLYSELISRIIRYNSIVEQHKGTFFLVEPDPDLREILDRIGLSTLVRVVPTEETAIGA
ncbi:MAG: STAS domain-containing protein [Chitinivibrionales bacterium]|nr:STAS domain-containing protein [Chitinivibrionales bacterium]MBD3395411.1 STAS domain-containing protein [Chitinivibrionales bacterium]